MKQHAAKDLRYAVDLLDTDGATTLVSGVGAGIVDLSGHRLEQAQLENSETTHMVLLRWADAQPLPQQGYISVTDPGSSDVTLYVVDYLKDPREPRPRVWTEAYCHVMRINS